jgi:Reverse transcriptase (RNA-dependent DNA polymerase)
LLVCLVRKSLYGFKQSARLWNRKLRRFLKKIGFYQLHSDHCVYINKDTGVILAMWVDDLIIFGKDRMEVDKMKDQMRSEFEMKDLGPLRYFVGILVQRDRERRTLRIDQSGYIDMILQRFDMENSTPVATPIATGTKLVKATDNDEVIDAKPYDISKHGRKPDVCNVMHTTRYRLCSLSSISIQRLTNLYARSHRQKDSTIPQRIDGPRDRI